MSLPQNPRLFFLTVRGARWEDLRLGVGEGLAFLGRPEGLWAVIGFVQWLKTEPARTGDIRAGRRK